MVSTRTAPRPAASLQDDLAAWTKNYEHLHIDVGTGDGTYPLRVARQNPDIAVIGIDTCLDNLTRAARRPHPNLRFLICDAADVPDWLHGRASAITINFPYGSLFHAIAGFEGHTLDRIVALARPGGRIEIRVNSSVAAEYGVPFDVLRGDLSRTMRRLAPRTASITVTPHVGMRSFPSTWAKRLAYGRPSKVIVASARMGI